MTLDSTLPDQLLSKPEVVQMTRLSPTSIYRHVKAGKLPMPRRQGNRSYWLLSQILDYLHALPEGYGSDPFARQSA